MSLLSALGGIGRGINQGARDYRDWEDFRFQKGQRERLLTEQTAEDESFGQLRGIQPEGEYEVPLEGPPAEGETMGKRKVKRSRADVAQDRAKIYQQSGARSFQQQAPQMQEQAYQLGERQRKDEAWAKIQAEMAMDDDTWLVKNLNWYHDNVPDGRGAGVISMPGGQRALIQYDQKTGRPGAPIPVTPQLMSDLKQRKALLELGMLTPENFLTAQDVQQKWATVANQGRSANAAVMTAQTGQGRLALEEADAPTRRGLWGAQTNEANERANLLRRTDPNLRAGAGAGATRPQRIDIQVPDEADPRKKIKMQVMVSTDASGNRKITDATGKDVSSNPRIMQAIEGMNAEATIMQRWEGIEAGLRDRLGKGEITPEQFDVETAQIRSRRDGELLLHRRRSEYANASYSDQLQIIRLYLSNGIPIDQVAVRLGIDPESVRKVQLADKQIAERNKKIGIQSAPPSRINPELLPRGLQEAENKRIASTYRTPQQP